VRVPSERDITIKPALWRLLVFEVVPVAVLFFAVYLAGQTFGLQLSAVFPVVFTLLFALMAPFRREREAIAVGGRTVFTIGGELRLADLDPVRSWEQSGLDRALGRRRLVATSGRVLNLWTRNFSASDVESLHSALGLQSHHSDSRA
jgi:hypothetical protein